MSFRKIIHFPPDGLVLWLLFNELPESGPPEELSFLPRSIFANSPASVLAFSASSNSSTFSMMVWELIPERPVEIKSGK